MLYPNGAATSTWCGRVRAGYKRRVISNDGRNSSEESHEYSNPRVATRVRTVDGHSMFENQLRVIEQQTFSLGHRRPAAACDFCE